jgi:hypothetical protein
MPKMPTKAEADELVRLYATEKMTLTRAASEVGCGLRAARSILLKAGIDVDATRRHREVPDKVRDEVARLYVEEELGAREIARKLDLHDPSFVYTVLKQRGIPARGTHGKNAKVGTEKTTTDGYVYEKVALDWPYLKDMPGAGGNGTWIRKHRKVMAEFLGRALLPSEQVHHINGDRSDNRIENLELRSGAHGSGVRFQCCECGSTKVEAVAISL